MCNGVLQPVHCVFYGAEDTRSVGEYAAVRLQETMHRVYTLCVVGYPILWKYFKEERSPPY